MEKKRTKFLLGGITYEHAELEPELAAGSVSRFDRGTEPEVIAQVPLCGGRTLEVHGYATHYPQEWVTVAWNDDNIQRFNCCTPAADVRRPAEGEWQGRYVPFYARTRCSRTCGRRCWFKCPTGSGLYATAASVRISMFTSCQNWVGDSPKRSFAMTSTDPGYS